VVLIRVKNIANHSTYCRCIALAGFHKLAAGYATHVAMNEWIEQLPWKVMQRIVERKQQRMPRELKEISDSFPEAFIPEN
jgi:hypothetical protein